LIVGEFIFNNSFPGFMTISHHAQVWQSFTSRLDAPSPLGFWAKPIINNATIDLKKAIVEPVS
jgi:hypothetical protein